MKLAVLLSKHPLDYKEIKELTESEREEYMKAERQLHQVQNYLFVPKMAFGNYEEFLSIMHYCLETWLTGSQTREEFMEITYLANKTLFNFLAAASFFTGFTRKEVESKFGSDSVELIAYKEITATAYESFSYRFMQKFRNHAIHAGLPVEGVSINQPKEAHEPARMIITQSAKELLKDKSYWKARLVADLEKMDQLDLVKLAAEYCLHLRKIDQAVQHILFPNLIDTSSAIFKTVHDALDHEGVPILIETFMEEGKLGYRDIRYPPLQLLSKLGFEYTY